MRMVVLVGPKHSGKTAAGKALAALLRCNFFDLDDLVAERRGKTPRALYAESPEIFREAETAALEAFFREEAGRVPARVMAAGGGIIDNPGVMAIIEKTKGAVFVYLDVSAQTAWERISRAGELPPFLAGENPREIHRRLHERRAEAYRRFAPLAVEAEGKSPEEIASEIIKII